MKFLPLLVLAALLLPFAAAAPVRNDSTLVVGDTTYYLSLCRNDLTGNQPEVELIDDCLTSGVYSESNNIDGLQVRAGIDDQGHPYEADIVLASLDTLPLP